MKITLQISNYDQLADGGPTFFAADALGFEIGREAQRDWTLPDPERVISGRHCEVKFQNDQYFLSDVSTNGTFLNGATSRMKSPHALRDGDAFQIGPYLITTRIEERLPSSTSPFEEPPTPPAGGPVSETYNQDIWADPSDAAPPSMDKRTFMAGDDGGYDPDFHLSPFGAPEMQTTPSHPNPPEGAAPAPLTPQPTAQSPFNTPEPVAPNTPFAPDQVPQEPKPEGFHAVPAGTSPLQVQPHAAAPQSGSPGAGNNAALLQILAAAAGIPEAAIENRPAEDVARELGEIVKIASSEVSMLLKARAAAKNLSKSSQRTVLSTTDNNPLKFVPTVEEALGIMIGRNRSGYLDGPASFQQAFDDLKKHEFATFSAMQQALHRLVEELSPDQIETRVSSSKFASKKSKAWEELVSVWDEKRNKSENGILDVFMMYFSEAYDKQSQ